MSLSSDNDREIIKTKAGELIVLGKFRKNNRTHLKILCFCGKIFSSLRSNIKSSDDIRKSRGSYSCGCFFIQNKHKLGKNLVVHGYCSNENNSKDDHLYYKYYYKYGKYNISPIYILWQTIKGKCFNPKASGYQWVGGKGITICDEWLDFNTFRSDVGEKKINHQFCRKDKNGDYEPDNCEWVPMKSRKIK